jgi:hypothetical protein
MLPVYPERLPWACRIPRRQNTVLGHGWLNSTKGESEMKWKIYKRKGCVRETRAHQHHVRKRFRLALVFPNGQPRFALSYSSVAMAAPLPGGWSYIPQDFDLGKGQTIEEDAIGPGKLGQWLAKVLAQESLIVLDACESGASDALRGGDRTHETMMAQLEHATGTNTISAAPAGQGRLRGLQGSRRAHLPNPGGP